jgi:hypothetical protein
VTTTEQEQAELDQLRAWLRLYPLLVQRVLLAGSRTWTRPGVIRQVLDVLPRTAVLVHGDAHGADKIGSMLWTHQGRKCEAHALPEGWWRHGRSIPLARDRAMVEAGADCCVAFVRLNSSGTLYTVHYALRHGIRTFIFRQDW